MTVVRLAAEERLTAAFARYDAAWGSAGQLEVVVARIELCEALADRGEALSAAGLRPLARDRALLAALEVISV